MIHDCVLLKDIQHLGNRRADKGIAAVGGAVIARYQRAQSRLLIQHKGAHRNAAAQGLGTGHDVGLHAVLLPCEQVAAPAHTALDLIQNQKRVVLLAECLHAL